ncbi:hypothetical protein ACFLSU_08520, partial [Bacteroidota bacterium]
MKDKIKRNIRTRWIESIFELAHSEFQKRLWIEADYENSVGDFTECVCSYFNDLNLDNGYSEFIEKGIISKTEFEIVAELHSEFNKYVERTEKQNLSDKNVLKDVEWINITKLGLKTWNKLKKNVELTYDKEL